MKDFGFFPRNFWRFSQATCHLIECAFALSLFLSPHKSEGDVIAAALENESWPAELVALLCLASYSKWGPESYIPYQFNNKDGVRKIIIQIMSRNCCRKCPTDWTEMCEELGCCLPISLVHITVCLWALSDRAAACTWKNKVPFRLHQASI